MTRAPNVIPNRVRDLSLEAWIPQNNLRDLLSLCEVLRCAQDDEFKNE